MALDRPKPPPKKPADRLAASNARPAATKNPDRPRN